MTAAAVDEVPIGGRAGPGGGRLLRALAGDPGRIWVTSSPEPISMTREPAGGSLVTVEPTTRPRHLTTTLATIGLDTVERGVTPDEPSADNG